MTTVAVKSRSHGSYHWSAERALSLATIPLFVGAFTGGSHPLIDLGLGIVIPLHCHLGFESIITDYVPKRKFKFAYYVLSASLAATTIAALYGCYQFNTNDVGITELSRRIWRNKTSHSL